MSYEVQSSAASEMIEKRNMGIFCYICADIVHLDSTTRCTDWSAVCFKRAQL